MQQTFRQKQRKQTKKGKQNKEVAQGLMEDATAAAHWMLDAIVRVSLGILFKRIILAHLRLGFFSIIFPLVNGWTG